MVTHKCNMCGINMGNIPMIGGACGRCHAEKQQREAQDRRWREEDDRRKRDEEQQKFDDLTRRAGDSRAQAQAGFEVMESAGRALKGILVQSRSDAGADIATKRVPAPSAGASCMLRIVAAAVGFVVAFLAVGFIVFNNTPKGQSPNPLLSFVVFFGVWFAASKLIVRLGTKHSAASSTGLGGPGGGPIALAEVASGWRCAHCGNGGQVKFRATRDGKRYEYCSRECAERGQEDPIPGWACAHCGQPGQPRFRGQVEGKTHEYCSRTCGEAAVVTCGKCRRTSRSDSAFCTGCGASLRPSACPGCGTANVPGAKFCASCGASLVGA